MHKVSVIVPVYNVRDYLGECLLSIINQSYRNLEIIIVNDGSTDGSGDICSGFLKIDSRVRLVQQENRGLSEARNTGLDNASGEYICFVDSDDSLNVNFVSKMVKSLYDNNSDLVECAVEKLGEVTSGVGSNFVIGGEAFSDYKYSYIVGGRGTPYAWNKMYNAVLLKELGLRFSLFGCEDYDFNMQFVANAKSIVLIGERLYNYRHRGGSISRSFSPKYFENLILCMRRKRDLMNRLGFFDRKSIKISRIWFMRSLYTHLLVLVSSPGYTYGTKYLMMRNILRRCEVSVYSRESFQASFFSLFVAFRLNLLIFTMLLISCFARKLKTVFLSYV